MSYNNNVRKHDRLPSSSSWHHTAGPSPSSYSGNANSLSMPTPSSHGDHHRNDDRGFHPHRQHHHHHHHHGSTRNHYPHPTRTSSSSHMDHTGTITTGRNPSPPYPVRESGVSRLHMNNGEAVPRRGGPSIYGSSMPHNLSIPSFHSNRVENGNGDRFSGVPPDGRRSSAYRRHSHHPHSTSFSPSSSSKYVSNAFLGSAQDASTTTPASSISCQRITPYLSSQPQLPQHSGVTVRSGSANTFNPNGGGGGTILYFSSIQKKGGAFTTTDKETQWQLNRRKRAPQEGGVSSSEEERSRNHSSELEKTSPSSSQPQHHHHQQQDHSSNGGSSIQKKPAGYSSSLPLSFVEAKNMFSEADRNRDRRSLQQEETSPSLLLGVYDGNHTKDSSPSSSCVGHPHYGSSSSGGTSSAVEVQTKIQHNLQTKKTFENRKRNRFELSLSDSDED